MASQGLGLDDEITMRLAQIFQWDIDFVLDIRSGDEFYILYKELYLGDEMIGFGDIWQPNSSIGASTIVQYVMRTPQE
ncbi:MAG: hypothetical protein CM1200mP24_01390 [Gammaproteobacteria bacterium]|nr:MAG: hypothetical protein CM1200mP24_01390 [Gammaproteobacteria bacterium]